MFSPRKILALAALVGVVGLSGGQSAQAATTKKKEASDSFLSLLTTNFAPTTTTTTTSSSTVHALATARATRGGVTASAVTPAQRRFIFEELRYLRLVEQQTLRLLRLQRNLGLLSPYDWYVRRSQVIIAYVTKQTELGAQLTGSAPFSPII